MAPYKKLATVFGNILGIVYSGQHKLKDTRTIKNAIRGIRFKRFCVSSAISKKIF